MRIKIDWIRRTVSIDGVDHIDTAVSLCPDGIAKWDVGQLCTIGTMLVDGGISIKSEVRANIGEMSILDPHAT